MKKIKFTVLLITVLMAMTMLFTACDETKPSTDNQGNPSTSTTQCDHNYTSKVTTEATCTKDGVKTFTCSICNDSYTEAIAATGKHNYTSKVTNEATCTKDGVKTFTCSMCKNSYTESIAAGHKWTNATCTVPKTCSVCKLTEGEALGHTTDNGMCGRCSTVIFKPLVYSGKGDKIITNVNLSKGLYKVSLTHSGKSNFIVIPFNGNGTRKNSWVNEIGVYSGSVVFSDSLNSGYLEVDADGEWTVTIETIQTQCTSNLKGSGDCVSAFFELPKGAQVVSMNYTGKSNFIVIVYDNTGRRYSSLANEIGNYSGEVIFNGGDSNKLFCVEVTASGDWSIDFGLTSEITTCTPPQNNGTNSENNTSSDKWSYSEASDLNTYANKATTNAQKAWNYAIDAMTASSTYKVLYNQYAVYYAGIAKGYLESMKAIADSNAELTLTNTNGKYSTLQEKIDYAYRLCDEIVNLQITSSNYATYEDKIWDVTQELALECLGIQKLSVDLIGAFAS